MKIATLAAALALVVLTSASRADTSRSRPTLTLEGARAVLNAGIEEARTAKAGGAIAVVDDGGNLMALERLDGTFPAGANISIGKARTAAMFKRPTKFFEEIIRNGRTPMIALPDFTPLQGGVPIMIDGQVVGAVGVSGAASADEDERIAQIAAKVLESGDAMTAGAKTETAKTIVAKTEAAKPADTQVRYYPAKQVQESFDAGKPLFDIAEHAFAVHTSRRNAAGLAEVHHHETDVIYVTEGEATFVTGGSVVEGKETAPNEIRGSAISGGEQRRLGKGDVVIVPAGVPHWFKEVPGAFRYYVVKVRGAPAGQLTAVR